MMSLDQQMLDRAIELISAAKSNGWRVDIGQLKALFSHEATGLNLPETLDTCICGSSPDLLAICHDDISPHGQWIICCGGCGRARVANFDLNWVPYGLMGEGMAKMLEGLLQLWSADKHQKEYEDQRALLDAYKEGRRQALQGLSDLLLNDSVPIHQRITGALSCMLEKEC